MPAGGLLRVRKKTGGGWPATPPMIHRFVRYQHLTTGPALNRPSGPPSHHKPGPAPHARSPGGFPTFQKKMGGGVAGLPPPAWAQPHPW
jgi:hypothetical protein